MSLLCNLFPYKVAGKTYTAQKHARRSTAFMADSYAITRFVPNKSWHMSISKLCAFVVLQTLYFVRSFRFSFRFPQSRMIIGRCEIFFANRVSLFYSNRLLDGFIIVFMLASSSLVYFFQVSSNFETMRTA